MQRAGYGWLLYSIAKTGTPVFEAELHISPAVQKQ